MFPRVSCVIALSGVLGTAFLSCRPPEERPVAEASSGAQQASGMKNQEASQMPTKLPFLATGIVLLLNMTAVPRLP